MKCKDCGDDYPRIRSNKREANGRFIYVDDKERKWIGTECPDCREALLDTPVYTNRKCRKCGCKLTADRYYDCTKCVETLPSDPSEAALYNA